MYSCSVLSNLKCWKRKPYKYDIRFHLKTRWFCGFGRKTSFNVVYTLTDDHNLRLHIIIH